jgi:endonuclease G
MKPAESESSVNENINREKVKNQKEEFWNARHLRTKQELKKEQETKRLHHVFDPNLPHNTGCSKNIGIFSMSPCFLDLAKAAASPVVRILSRNFGFKGTGFMISDKLLMTNSHVIPTIVSAKNHFVEFNYELDGSSCPKPVTRFSFAPHIFFVSSSFDDLDFTIIAIGERILGKGALSEFGYCPLVDFETQSIDGVNCMIHHPGGGFKRLTFLNKQVVAQTEEILHYYAATQSGSSGAPVFNTKFELVAMHHCATPSRRAFSKGGQLGPNDANEGIRISAIIKRINAEKHKLPKKQVTLIKSALTNPFKQPSLVNRD